MLKRLSSLSVQREKLPGIAKNARNSRCQRYRDAQRVWKDAIVDHPNLSSSVRPHGALLGATMKIGLFTEFSYPGKSERQAYAEVLAQISLADEIGYDFFSTTESFGKDEVSCSPFPLGLYIAAAQRARRIRFLTGIITVPI